MTAPQTILVRISSDICTKARGTRGRFSRRLTRNLGDALTAAGIEHRIEPGWSRSVVEAWDPRAAEVLARTFGVHSLSVVERVSWSELEDLLREGERVLAPRVAGKRFAVRARRGPDRRRIPFGSDELERLLGERLVHGAAAVDLERPEVTAGVEVHAEEAFFFSDRILGPGGLPLGVEGRALALVSGGFDSAVAAWLMLKRGVALDYLFFNLGGPVHEQGVLRVLKVLADRWSYGDRPRLHAVDFRGVAHDLQERTRPRYWQVLLKRLMLRAADGLVRRLGRPAMVTGDAVGQVSSQTLQNLAVLSEATPVTVLRPLVGFNKEEIMSLARRIGTYEISAAVQEYCALLPHHPATSSSLRPLRREEAKLDLSLLDRLVEERRVFALRGLSESDLQSDHHAVDTIPAEATVVDLRSLAAYRAWHLPGAVHLDFLHASRRFQTMERDRTYVFYCEFGLKSAQLAGSMNAAGFRAFHYARPIDELRRGGRVEDPLESALLAPAYRGDGGGAPELQ